MYKWISSEITELSGWKLQCADGEIITIDLKTGAFSRYLCISTQDQAINNFVVNVEDIPKYIEALKEIESYLKTLPPKSE